MCQILYSAGAAGESHVPVGLETERRSLKMSTHNVDSQSIESHNDKPQNVEFGTVT